MVGDQELRIRERAHVIWEKEGRPEGRAATHWQMAAAEIAAEGKGSTKAKPRAAKAADPGAAAPAKKAAPARAAAARTTATKRSRKAAE
jgi:hypothetical protein